MEHEKGPRRLFQWGSARLQAAAMMPGLFPSSDCKSAPGRPLAKNTSQRDAINTEPGDLQEKGNIWHIGNAPVVKGGLLVHALLTWSFAGILFSWEKLGFNLYFCALKVAGTGFC